MLTRLWPAILVAMLLPAFPSAFAQTLAMSGFVLDPSGAAVPNAPLEVHALSGATSGAIVAQGRSAGNGAFRIPGLSAGDYVLTVPAFSSFAERTMRVHLSTKPSDLRVVLALASVTQQVTVSTGQELSTEASQNVDTVAVESGELRKLPAVDLDYVAALSSLLDASSASSGGTTLVVDGIEMKSVAVAPSAIQEVRINNDPYSTEFNRPGRGRIEVTTKPGSENYHGEADFLYRDARFNATNHFATTRPHDVRVLTEGHITGPVGHAKHTNFIA
ncbi:MAG TPA: carboxypeptidase-like regulatory domain-containing protein, partial [Bryobacteraceae bacterium]